MKMYTWTSVWAISDTDEGVVVSVAGSKDEAIARAFTECLAWSPEDADALLAELQERTPYITPIPSAFLSRVGS